MVEGDEVENFLNDEQLVETQNIIEETTISIHAMAGSSAPNTLKVLSRKGQRGRNGSF